jgi:glycolate oxidase
MLNNALQAKLRDIAGAGNCLTSPLQLESYAYDSSTFSARPEIVVLPETAEQVCQILALAHAERLPVVARGGGTSLSGGAVPQRGGLVLAMNRMNKILNIDTIDETVLAQAGVVNLHLQEALAAHGYMFAPDPASHRACTLGGNLAEGAGGLRGIKYGVMRNHVLGLEAALADGRRVSMGSLSCNDFFNANMLGIMMASEGMFAVALTLELQITPLPPAVRTASVYFEEMEDAGQAVSEIIGSGIIPAIMEIMDQRMIAAVEDYLGLGLKRDAKAMLLMEVDGLGPELDRQMATIAGICQKNGGARLLIAQSEEDRAQLWLARRSANGAIGRIKPAAIVQDLTVPRDRLSKILKEVQQAAERHNIIIAQIAHAGDGNLHPHILYHPSDPEERQRAWDACLDIYQMALAAGGTLSGEHGIGLEKQAAMPMQFSQQEMEFMAKVKLAFDPRQILNPGKVLPEPIWESALAARRGTNLA